MFWRKEEGGEMGGEKQTLWLGLISFKEGLKEGKRGSEETEKKKWAIR